jgi:hypothetical protein
LRRRLRSGFGTLREQADLQQQWLEKRITTLLPPLMPEHAIDLWVVPMREYNEDPVFTSLVSPTTFAARRRTIYVFHDRGPKKGIERIALGGSSQGGLFRRFAVPPVSNRRVVATRPSSGR